MSDFTRAAIFHRPDLFKTADNVSLLYSYLDDFMCGAGFWSGSLTNAFNHALQQMAYLHTVGNWLGLSFKDTKMELPSTRHALLGLTLDTLQRSCSLKPGKASKVAVLIDEMLGAQTWKLKELQKLCGNTVWLSMILPRVRSYLTPAIEMQKRIPQLKGSFPKSKLPNLDEELIRSMKFLRSVFLIDPAVHVNRFLRLLPTHKTILWSDASGFENLSKNPTPGRLASIFLPPFSRMSEVVFRYSDWLDILPLIQSVTEISGTDWWSEAKSCSRLDLRKKDLGIAYLELTAAILTFIEVLLLAFKSQRTWKRLRRKNIILKCDNANVVSWFAKGRCRYYPWNKLLEFIFLIELILQCRIVVEWVGSDHQEADGLTRGIMHTCFGKRKITAWKHSDTALKILAEVLVVGPPINAIKDYLNGAESSRNYDPDVSGVFSLPSELLKAARRHWQKVREKMSEVPAYKVKAAWKLVRHLVFLGRNKSSWRKFTYTDAFFVSTCSDTERAQVKVKFDTVLFCTQLALKLLRKNFSDFLDFKKRLQTSFLKFGRSTP